MWQRPKLGEADVEGEQTDTLFVALGSAQANSKEHKTRIIRTIAEKNPNMVVTLSESLEEG